MTDYSTISKVLTELPIEQNNVTDDDVIRLCNSLDTGRTTMTSQHPNAFGEVKSVLSNISMEM